jgi:S1-C subfamily serine protease
MKRFGSITIAVAVFLGVLAALQVNRFLEARRATAEPISWREGAMAIPTLGPASGSGYPAAPTDFREAAKKVIPSVVSVDQYNRYQSWFDDSDELRETGTGSGVVISKNGIIVTNNHVVEIPRDRDHNIGEQVKVRLPDKRTFIAKVVGRDRRSDLAVLQISANDLQPIEIGDSSKLEVGQWVVAVGNPLGFDNTVSVGVVSSLGRTLGLENSVLLDGIQTDAAINPGNSGGALTDAAGQLVGINSAIASGNGGSVGIGFAIPVNTVRRVVDQILKFGYAKYGNLGVSYHGRSFEILQSRDGRAQLSEMVGAEPPDHGLILTTVVPGEAAGRAGLQKLDVLLSIDGQKLDETLDYNRAMGAKQPGDTVTISYWSRGQTHIAKIKLDEVRGD